MASVKKLPRDLFSQSNLEVVVAMHQNSYFQEISAQQRAGREAYTKKKKTNEVNRKLAVDRQIQNFQVLPTNQANTQDVSRPSRWPRSLQWKPSKMCWDPQRMISF